VTLKDAARSVFLMLKVAASWRGSFRGPAKTLEYTGTYSVCPFESLISGVCDQPGEGAAHNAAIAAAENSAVRKAIRSGPGFMRVPFKQQ